MKTFLLSVFAIVLVVGTTSVFVGGVELGKYLERERIKSAIERAKEQFNNHPMPR